MNIFDLFTANKSKRRLARGVAGKGGKTAGRGTKGQKSRTGYKIPNGFEGGQSTIITRTPKRRGGLNKKNQYLIINFDNIKNDLSTQKLISKDILLKLNIIQKKDQNKIIKLSNFKQDKEKVIELTDVQLTKK